MKICSLCVPTLLCFFQSECIILTDNILNKSLQDWLLHHIPVKTTRIASTFTAFQYMLKFSFYAWIWVWMHSKPAERFLLKDAARRSSCTPTSTPTTSASSATTSSTSIPTWPGSNFKVGAPALQDAQLQLGDPTQTHSYRKAQYLDSR